MLKVFIFAMMLFASAAISKENSLHFSEERYIYAIDETFSKTGHIHFEDAKTKVTYDNDITELIYHQDEHKLDIQQGEDERRTVDADRAVQMFFLLLRAIYFEDKTSLRNFFTIHTKRETTNLIPKGNIGTYIHHVNYKKSDDKLIYLHIQMQDEDRIVIEEIDE